MYKKDLVLNNLQWLIFHKPNQSNKTNDIKRKIMNLSAYKLKTNQINLLKLCLKFCPTPKGDIGESKTDLKEFERKFKLIEKFNHKKKTDDSQVKKIDPNSSRTNITIVN